MYADDSLAHLFETQMQNKSGICDLGALLFILYYRSELLVSSDCL